VQKQVLTGLLLPWPAGGSRTAERAQGRLADLWPGRLAGGKPDSARQVQGIGGP
jgi:hypothetical protein